MTLKPDVVAQQRVQLEPQIPLQQHHQRRDLGDRTLPVLDRERVERQDADAEPGRALDDLAHRLDAGAVPLDPRQVPLRRPAAVAVHDDGEVLRQPVEVDLPGEPRLRGTLRHDGQDVFKGHAETVIISSRGLAAPRSAGPQTGGVIRGIWAKAPVSDSGSPFAPMFELARIGAADRGPGTRGLNTPRASETSPCGGAVRPACERSRESSTASGTPRVPSSDADLDQRADDVPDHVAQESIACDADDQRQVESAAVLDLEGKNGPLGRSDRRAGSLEAGEIVAADERSRGGAHRLDVERLRDVPDVAVQERRDERRIDDPVLVGLRAGVEPGVEVRSGISSTVSTRTSSGSTAFSARASVGPSSRLATVALATCA